MAIRLGYGTGGHLARRGRPSPWTSTASSPANQASWHRLEQLTAAARGRGARLRPAEVDELVQLYQRASTHLSHARTEQRRPGARRPPHPPGGRGRRRALRHPVADRWPGVARFFTTSFPAAVWHARRFVLVSALLLLVPAVADGRVARHAPTPRSRRPPRTPLREAYVEDDFEAYYSSAPAGRVRHRR